MRELCLKNAAGFDGKRSKLHWHLKQASLAHEAYFIFLGDFLGKETDFYNKVLSTQRLITPLSFGEGLGVRLFYTKSGGTLSDTTTYILFSYIFSLSLIFVIPR